MCQENLWSLHHAFIETVHITLQSYISFSSQSNLWQVHLPGQNIFCPDKKIFPKLKSTCIFSREMNGKFCPWLKTHFPSNPQANIFFFSLGKKLLSGQKIFCPGRWIGHQSLSLIWLSIWWPLTKAILTEYCNP